MSKEKLNSSARNCLNEITRWENKVQKLGFCGVILKYVNKPIEWFFDFMPNFVKNTISKAVEGCFGILIFGADYTFSDKLVLSHINKCGGNVHSIDDVFGQDIDVLKKSASWYITQNNLLAALEGGGTGLGGLALIAADIPALFTITFRTIMQIGLTFGYDVTSVEEKRFIMNIIDLASGEITAMKINTMLGKEALLNYVKKTSIKHMEQIAAVKVGDKIVEEVAREILKSQGKRATQKAIKAAAIKITEDVAKDGTKALALTAAREQAKNIGEELTKKKLGQLIPLAGAIIGAGFNFWFLWSVGEAAYYGYLKRHIYDRFEIVDEKDGE